MQASSLPPISTHDLVGQHPLLVALGRLIREFRRNVDDRGLEPSEVAILFDLKVAGPQRASAIAESVHLDLSTVSRTVSRLVEQQLLERGPDPDDGRAWLLSLTDTGFDFLRQALTRRAALLSEATREWDSADVEALTRLLARLGEDISQREMAAHADVIQQQPRHNSVETDKEIA